MIEKIFFGRANNMDASPVNAMAMQQAAMATCVLGIVFNDFAL